MLLSTKKDRVKMQGDITVMKKNVNKSVQILKASDRKLKKSRELAANPNKHPYKMP